MNVIKKYSNGEVTVIWQPDKCIHSTICFRGLGDVFDPRKRPWVAIDKAPTQSIVDQVKKCPSGALSYTLTQKEEKVNKSAEVIVEPAKNGPLMVHGPVIIRKADGSEERREKTAFCRCGASLNKPFCDGSHNKAEFNAD